MTLTLLDLYNTAAAQEWSMYDADAVTTEQMEQSLLISINKAVTEILYSYPFHFRERTHVIFAMPKINSYELPNGLIIKDNQGNYSIKINSTTLKLVDNPFVLEEKSGVPQEFYIKGNNLILYPTPIAKSIITIDFLTLAIGENKDDEEIFSLASYDDKLLIPEHLEEIFKQTVISKTLLNSLASESDENYSAYKKQYETAYKLLIKYSKGVGLDKSVKI